MQYFPLWNKYQHFRSVFFHLQNSSSIMLVSLNIFGPIVVVVAVDVVVVAAAWMGRENKNKIMDHKKFYFLQWQVKAKYSFHIFHWQIFTAFVGFSISWNFADILLTQLLKLNDFGYKNMTSWDMQFCSRSTHSERIRLRLSFSCSSFKSHLCLSHFIFEFSHVEKMFAF